MPGNLYVVGTPIGNLSDLSARAGEVLRAVEVVYAEDTRRTRVLLRHVGSRTALRSLHAHNEESRIEELVARLAAGEACALVTDAGVPGISDPGARAVAAAGEAGASVIPIPGPSAVVAALSASGLSADRFAFLGFPPRRGGRRQEWLRQAVRLPMTVVAFESPERLGRLLADLAGSGGADRRCVVCRELTKVHEEVRRGTVASLAEYYTGTGAIGEVTLVLEGLSEALPGKPPDLGEAERVAREMAREGRTTREIARRLTEGHGLSRNLAYEIGLRAGRGAGR